MNTFLVEFACTAGQSNSPIHRCLHDFVRDRFMYRTYIELSSTMLHHPQMYKQRMDELKPFLPIDKYLHPYCITAEHMEYLCEYEPDLVRHYMTTDTKEFLKHVGRALGTLQRVQKYEHVLFPDGCKFSLRNLLYDMLDHYMDDVDEKCAFDIWIPFFLENEAFAQRMGWSTNMPDLLCRFIKMLWGGNEWIWNNKPAERVIAAIIKRAVFDYNVVVPANILQHKDFIRVLHIFYRTRDFETLSRVIGDVSVQQTIRDAYFNRKGPTRNLTSKDMTVLHEAGMLEEYLRQDLTPGNCGYKLVAFMLYQGNIPVQMIRNVMESFDLDIENTEFDTPRSVSPEVFHFYSEMRMSYAAVLDLYELFGCAPLNSVAKLENTGIDRDRDIDNDMYIRIFTHLKDKYGLLPDRHAIRLLGAKVLRWGFDNLPKEKLNICVLMIGNLEMTRYTWHRAVQNGHPIPKFVAHHDDHVNSRLRMSPSNDPARSNEGILATYLEVYNTDTAAGKPVLDLVQLAMELMGAQLDMEKLFKYAGPAYRMYYKVSTLFEPWLRSQGKDPSTVYTCKDFDKDKYTHGQVYVDVRHITRVYTLRQACRHSMCPLDHLLSETLEHSIRSGDVQMIAHMARLDPKRYHTIKYITSRHSDLCVADNTFIYLTRTYPNECTKEFIQRYVIPE